MRRHLIERAALLAVMVIAGVCGSAAAGDLVLEWSTFLGGAGHDFAYGVALDSAGSVYVVGDTASAAFPTTAGSFSTSMSGGSDAYVAKVNSSGTALLYATFIGGSGSGADYGRAVAVDGAGCAYVAGHTACPDFPTTAGALDTTYNGGVDAYVAKLSASGATLLYSTFVGGSNYEEGLSLALDASGNALVAGFTYSPDFPTTPGAYDTSFGGVSDAYVAKLDAAGAAFVYSTVVGAGGYEEALDVALDGSGNAVIVGFTKSNDFPTTPGAFDTTRSGLADIVVAKVDPSGSSLLYSTFLGGSSDDYGLRVAADAAGNAWITGFTYSGNFPVTAGAYDTSHNGWSDAVVAELNASGTALVYATFLGGGGDDHGSALTVDPAGNAYVTGYTSSTNFPTTSGAFDTALGGTYDAFASVVAAAG